MRPADPGEDEDEVSELVVVVSIEEPAPGTALDLGDSVDLAGSAATEEGEEIRGATYTWVSSIEGEIGVGDSLTWTPQEAGEHILTLRVESEGSVGAASVDVTATIPIDQPPVTVYRDELGVLATDWRGLAVDRNGDVYGATSKGLVVWRAEVEALELYTTASGLQSDDVHAVVVDRVDTVWLGYEDAAVEGERVELDPDEGTVRHWMDLHFTETGEMTSIYRLRIQPYGLGVGDIWMGTNEGLCVYDADLDVLQEHVHPNHPHGLTFGVGFSGEGDVWNGDQYQLSRYRYTNDGNLDGSDYWEHWVPWPVQESVDTINIDDMDTAENTSLYLASQFHGVARIRVGPVGQSVTEYLDKIPAETSALRVDPLDKVWIGTPGDGLYVLQHGTDEVMHLAPEVLEGFEVIQQLAVDTRTDPPTVWAAGPAGLMRLVGLPE